MILPDLYKDFRYSINMLILPFKYIYGLWRKHIEVFPFRDKGFLYFFSIPFIFISMC